MRLNEICEVYSGYALKSFNDSEVGLPVVKIGNILTDGTLNLDECQYTTDCVNEKYYSNKDDIYIALSGATIGKIGIMDADERYVVNQRVGIVRKKSDDVPQEYIKYFLLKQTNRILQEAAGCAQPNISPKQIAEYSVPEVSKEKMFEVCIVLDTIKRIIDMRKAELTALDNLIKARFVEMFGDPLDKIKANKYFVDCVEFNPKKTEVKERMKEKASFVPMECVGVDGSFIIKEDGLVEDYYRGYTYFKDGDVLLAKITPCFENGKVAIAENCTNGIGFGTTEFHVLRPILGVSNSYWIKYMFKNDIVHGLATINMTGSAGQKRIQTPFFEKLKIYLPPIEKQEQFAAFVYQVDKSKFVKPKRAFY